MIEFTLHYRKKRQVPTDQVYDLVKQIRSADDLTEVATWDNTVSCFATSYRSESNFLECNVIGTDFDNGESDDPISWITPDVVATLLPNVCFLYVPSRHNMIGKEYTDKKTGEKKVQSPRPKFHVYLPLKKKIQNVQDAKNLLAKWLYIFPSADQQVSTPVCCFFGYNEPTMPEATLVDGELDIQEYFDKNPQLFKGMAASTSFVPPAAAIVNDGDLVNVLKKTSEEVGSTVVQVMRIPEGSRNTVLMNAGINALTKHDDTPEAQSEFIRTAQLCDPPLSTKELATIWRHCVRMHLNNKTRGDYVPPDEYAAKMQTLSTVSAAVEHQHKEQNVALVVNQAKDIATVPETTVEVQDQAAAQDEPQKRKRKQPISIQMVQDVLTALDVDVWYDVITKDISISGVTAAGYAYDESALVTTVHDILNKVASGVTMQVVRAYLTNIARESRRNPVLELIDSVPWDGQERIPQLFDLFGFLPADDLSRVLLTKWLKQCYALLLNGTSVNPVGAAGILVVMGEQGAGKTLLFKHLAFSTKESPTQMNWFAESARLTSNKDDIINAISYWITELGEPKQTSLTEGNRDFLKGFITKAVDDIRKPFAPGRTIANRTTSLVATVNDDRFLTDQTGNRRYWTIRMRNKHNPAEIFSIDAQQLWAEVKAKYNPDDMFDWRLTTDEQDQLEERNRFVLDLMEGEQEILDIRGEIELHPEAFKHDLLTASQFKTVYSTYLGKISSVQVGRVLSRYTATKTLHGCVYYDVRVPIHCVTTVYVQKR